MGLNDIVPEEQQQSNAEESYRQYSVHEYEDTLIGWIDELQDRFPEEVQVDFIEVSPEMTSTHGYAYRKPGGIQYIRIAEFVTEDYPQWYQKMVVLHEMVHMFMYQRGMDDVSDGDPLFEWVLGTVGADVNGLGPETTEEKYEVMADFLHHYDRLPDSHDE